VADPFGVDVRRLRPLHAVPPRPRSRYTAVANNSDVARRQVAVHFHRLRPLPHSDDHHPARGHRDQRRQVHHPGGDRPTRTSIPTATSLLHDVGTGDFIVQNGGQSTLTKLRTPPLWGLRTHDRLDARHRQLHVGTTQFSATPTRPSRCDSELCLRAQRHPEEPAHLLHQLAVKRRRMPAGPPWPGRFPPTSPSRKPVSHTAAPIR